MSIFVEACKEYTLGKQSKGELDVDKTRATVFNLREAIKKEKAAYEKDSGEESKRREDKLLNFLTSNEYYNFL